MAFLVKIVKENLIKGIKDIVIKNNYKEINIFKNTANHFTKSKMIHPEELESLKTVAQFIKLWAH